MRLRALAPGKVNLCLFLGGARADRRHELVTLFESVSLADELTLATLPRGACLTVQAPDIHGDTCKMDLTTPFSSPDQAATVARVLLMLDEAVRRPTG